MAGAAGIFAGIRILELGAGAAGPVATRYFADQGATVVRVESALRPDFLRLIHQSGNDPHGLDASPMFVLMNPNKKSVSINLSTPEGVGIVKRLIGWADVVSENFSPKAMTRWGLDYAALREEFPGLVMVSSCLFGQTGPQRMYPGFGGQGSAISGFNHLTGWPKSFGDKGSLIKVNSSIGGRQAVRSITYHQVACCATKPVHRYFLSCVCIMNTHRVIIVIARLQKCKNANQQ